MIAVHLRTFAFTLSSHSVLAFALSGSPADARGRRGRPRAQPRTPATKHRPARHQALSGRRESFPSASLGAGAHVCVRFSNRCVHAGGRFWSQCARGGGRGRGAPCRAGAPRGAPRRRRPRSPPPPAAAAAPPSARGRKRARPCARVRMHTWTRVHAHMSSQRSMTAVHEFAAYGRAHAHTRTSTAHRCPGSLFKALQTNGVNQRACRSAAGQSGGPASNWVQTLGPPLSSQVAVTKRTRARER